MRKILWAASIVLGSALAAGLFLFLYDLEPLRAQLEDQISQRTGRKTKLGKLRVQLFPPGARAEELDIQYLVKAPRVSVRSDYASLLRREAVLTRLDIEDALVAGVPGPMSATLFDITSTGDFRGEVRAPASSLLKSMPGNITAQITRRGEQITAERLVADLPGAHLEGRAEARLGSSPLQASLQLKGDKLELQPFLRAFGYEGSGQADLDIQARTREDKWTLTGGGPLRNVRAEVPGLQNPIEAPAATLVLDGNRIQLDGLTLRTGQSEARGWLRLQPTVAFDLDSPQLRLSDFATTGRAHQSASPKLSARGRLRAAKLITPQGEFNDVMTAVDYDRGFVRLDGLTARMYGGSFRGAVRHAAGSTTVQGIAEDLDAQQLLGAATAAGKALTGKLRADFNLTLRPPPKGELAEGLTGSVKLHLDRGRLNGVALLDEIQSLAKIAGYLKSPRGFTDIASLDGDFDLRDGLALTDNLSLTLSDGSAQIRGMFGLATHSLNLRINSRVANRNLVIPARITGTFADPKFAVDSLSLGTRALQSDVVKEKAQGILDSIFKKKPKQ